MGEGFAKKEAGGSTPEHLSAGLVPSGGGDGRTLVRLAASDGCRDLCTVDMAMLSQGVGSPRAPGHRSSGKQPSVVVGKVLLGGLLSSEVHNKGLGSLELSQAGAAQFYINSPALLVLPFEFQMQTELKSPPWPTPLPLLSCYWCRKPNRTRKRCTTEKRLHRSRAKLSKLRAIPVLKTSGVVL